MFSKALVNLAFYTQLASALHVGAPPPGQNRDAENPERIIESHGGLESSITNYYHSRDLPEMNYRFLISERYFTSLFALKTCHFADSSLLLIFNFVFPTFCGSAVENAQSSGQPHRPTREQIAARYEALQQLDGN